MQVNVHEAKSQLSRLLELVGEGERVVIARNGDPVAELVPVRRETAFPFGIAHDEPLVSSGDEWWRPMSDAEAEEWTEGR
jgi:prevent-host-death family protein